MIGTIAQEAAACRKRFADVKVGSWVRCCHHEVLIEELGEPPENRIAYILAKKSTMEQARRLREFAPIPPEMGADYDVKRATLRADYGARCATIRADYDAKRATIRADYEAKCVQLQAPIIALVPDTTWTGESIFPQTGGKR